MLRNATLNRPISFYGCVFSRTTRMQWWNMVARTTFASVTLSAEDDYCRPGRSLPIQPHRQISVRYFAKKNKMRHNKSNQKKKKKKRREEEEEDDFHRRKRRQQMSMNNLHPAAKWKRVLSACDYWWSDANLIGDEFMRETLKDHAGWMPISTLLTFPRLKYWTNETILLGAFLSTGGQRYEVSFDERLWNPPGLSSRIRRKLTSPQRSSSAPAWKDFVGDDDDLMEEMMGWDGYENNALDVHQTARKQLQKPYYPHSSTDDEDDNNWDHDLSSVDVYSDDDNSDLSDYASSDDENLSSRDNFEYNNTYPGSSKNSQALSNKNTEKNESMQFENTESSEVISEFLAKTNESLAGNPLNQFEQDNNEKIHNEKITDDEDPHTRQKTSDLISDEDDWSDLSWSDDDDDNNDIDKDRNDRTKHRANTGSSQEQVSSRNIDTNSDPEEPEFELEYLSKSSDGYLPDRSTKRGMVTPDDDQEDEDQHFPIIWREEKLPQDLSNAFVRKKKVTLARILAIEEKAMIQAEDTDDETEAMAALDLEQSEIGDEQAFELQQKEIQEKKKASMKKYSTDRDVIILKHPDEISTFCRAIIQSTNKFASRHKNNSKARAIGFDVEYCSLDYDIRLLPAMIQISSPGDDGLVGLLWIDKFPNHGRDMLSDTKCSPLISLLSDSTIAKVGVGVSKDAKRLAEWWGVNDPKFVSHFISNVIDLENDLDDRVNQRSLREMAKHALNRDLPKLKERGKEAERQKQKQGKKRFTAHWRRPTLTDNMIEYAVSDVACSIDVWLQISGITLPDAKKRKSTRQNQGSS